MQRELVQLRASNNALPQSRRDLEQLLDSVRQFARQAVAQVDLGAVLRPLEPELADPMIAGREITTKPAAALNGQLTRTVVSLRFQSPYDRFFSVLRRLEESGRLIRVERISADAAADPNGKPLQVEIDFSAFCTTSEELTRWATAE